MRDLLVNYLESLAILDSRYTALTCINYQPGAPKIGFFSLVFRAHDTVEDVPVALKFYDPDVSMDPYRLSAFDREPAILQKVIGQRRCLQLIMPMQTHSWQYDPTLVIPTKYFAVNWIDGEVDEIFQNQDRYDSIDKLRWFIDILTAVEALHRNGIFHRDIKPDNMRFYLAHGRRIVVLIDMGTAARADTVPIIADYAHPVGHQLYAAPEAWCGLAGHRDVANCSDFYALGCVVYELFNRDFFGAEIRRNPRYGPVLAAIAVDVAGKPRDKRVQAWKQTVMHFRHAVIPPSIDGAGSSVHPSVSSLLNDLLHKLVKFDFVERARSFDWIRDRAVRAITTLENVRMQERALERRAVQKQNRLAKLALRSQKSQGAVGRKKGFKC